MLSFGRVTRPARSGAKRSRAGARDDSRGEDPAMFHASSLPPPCERLRCRRDDVSREARHRRSRAAAPGGGGRRCGRCADVRRARGGRARMAGPAVRRVGDDRGGARGDRGRVRRRGLPARPHRAGTYLDAVGRRRRPGGCDDGVPLPRHHRRAADPCRGGGSAQPRSSSPAVRLHDGVAGQHRLARAARLESDESAGGGTP